MNTKRILKWAAAALIPAAAIITFLLLSGSAEFAAAASEKFSFPLRMALGRINSHIPFSVTELLLTLGVIGVIIFIIDSIVKAKRFPPAGKMLLRRFLILLLVAAYILSLFLWVYGIDYRKPTFAQVEGLNAYGVTPEALYRATLLFMYGASTLADTVPRDADGHFTASPDEFLPDCTGLYAPLQEMFPSLAGECYKPKQMTFSKLMSVTGFTGMFFPFTGESNLNVDSPACLIPVTAAHELAHQLGVTSEDECNFLGIAACLYSDDPVYRYSGWLFAAMNLMNALHDTSLEAWQAVRDEFVTGNLKTDWDDNNEYWWKYETDITIFSEKVYDTYLKANGNELGILSYGACVNLLINCFGVEE